MTRSRREFLAATATLAAGLSVGAPLVAAAATEVLPRTLRRRVVIVGGGWGGLSAARRLRAVAPELEVAVIERNAEFWSCPLSNKWLVGLSDERLLVHNYERAAAAFGYTFVRSTVVDIDRDRRRVIIDEGAVGYDWLILSVGIRYAYETWFDGDRQAAAYTQEHYPCAYVPGDEFRVLKRKLDGFNGGDLVMTLPPAPYRCPPSPYERACAIAWLLKSRHIKGRLTLIDPNPAALAFQRTFDLYADQLVYVPQSAIKSVDPFNRKIVTEFDEFRFDDAILMPPQQAGDLIRQANLVVREGHDKGWAALDPLHLHARDDESVFLVGDLAGNVSPLFGSYPKSGHMAAALGRIAANEIAARAHDKPPPALLPESICHVFTSFDPPETTRFHANYRLRGDGVIAQVSDQHHDPNPRDENVHWATSQFADFLAD